MKKTLLVLALAVVLTIAFATTAYADHSPDFYVSWNGTSGPNAGTGSPHGNYSKTTVKCAVCHAVHRAAVAGQAGLDAAWGGSTYVPGTAATGPTQLLLRSNVANACTYCHIETGIGGVRIYNGNAGNIGNWVNSGYGHGNACTDCHAVHGAATFKGAMITKDLKWDQYKGGGMLTGVAPLGASLLTAQPAGPEHAFINPDTSAPATSTMQDEIFLLGIANGGTSNRVAADNIPMFLGDTVLNVVNGTNLNTLAGYTNVHEAQGSAFCTQCHMNFSASSDTTVNVDNEMALFQGWAAGTANSWAASPAGIYTSKNHPMKPASASWSGHGATFVGKIAWTDATYCRSCHDAGEVNANQAHPAGYVVENSYPHATPGYLDFMTAAPAYPGIITSGIGSTDTTNVAVGPGNKDSYADGAQAATPTPGVGVWPQNRWTITQPADVSGLENYGSWYSNGGTTKVWNDGSCLKCHVSGVDGVGKTF